jgi:hypothetical protein
MPNAKRDMLFKLLALRGFLGDDYFYKEDRVLFEIPVVDQKARIDKLLLVAEDEEESLEEFKARKHREAMLKKEELEAKHAKELDDDESLEEFKARKHREAMALKDASAVNATNNTGMSVSRATDFEDTDDSSSSSEQENPDESLEAFKARKHREALAKRKAQQGDDPQQFRPVLGGLVEADESSSGESSSEDEVAEKANNSQVSFAARQIVRRPRIDESSSSSGSSGTDSSDSEDAAPSLRKPNLAPATKNNNSGGGRPTSSIMRRPLRRAADESSSSSSDSD